MLIGIALSMGYANEFTSWSCYHGTLSKRILDSFHNFLCRKAMVGLQQASCAGWDRLAIGGDYLRNCLAYEGYNDYMMLVLW